MSDSISLSPPAPAVERSRPPVLPETLVLVAQARLCHPVPGERWEWEAITHGGSDRDFFRARHSTGASWVVMRYTDAREENVLYAAIAGFLRDRGLAVPELYFHDAARKLIGLQDLGDESLYTAAHSTGGAGGAIPLYLDALDQARRLHTIETATVPLMPGFDDKLYRWERQYFLENLVERWGGIHPDEAARAALEREGEEMAAQLLALPRCLIHRDFQSQNLMARDGRAWLIDFQGMRWGHAAYDIASLLYDPYVDLGPERRGRLLAHYVEAAGGDAHAFGAAFHRAAAQRLMQALGAYGFLGLVKGKKEFLRHIPRGLAHLADALERLGGMPRTRELVDRIRVEKRRAV